MTFECHITIKGDPERVKPIVEAVEGWHFSRIDGDPELGEGVKCYATKHHPWFTLPQAVFNDLEYAEAVLTDKGLEIIRKKIEVILYDKRNT